MTRTYVPAKLVPTTAAMGPSPIHPLLGLCGRDSCCGLGGPKLCECGGGVWVRGWRVDVGVRGDVTARLWLCDNSVCVCV